MMPRTNYRFTAVPDWRYLPSVALLIVVSLISSSAVADVHHQSIAKLLVKPSVINLSGRNRCQQVVVTGQTESGAEIDLTRSCNFNLGDGCAKLRDTIIVGVRNGADELVVRFADVRVTVPVKVSGHDEYPPVDFVSDVVPLLTKHNCNSAGCHGKQGGQNGFQLSVFGFDPAADYSAICIQSRGRRLSRTAPEQSLFYRKATGRLAHGGGQRIDVGSSDARLLKEWIHQGIRFANKGTPGITNVEVFPAERILGASTGQQLLVTAIYSDGTKKDVTADAAYTSNAESIAGVDANGLVQTGKTPGEAAITVAYMGHVSVSRILIPRLAPLGYAEMPTNNQVDEFVSAKLKKMGIAASELCDDATFLRRLYIDTIGTLPTVSEVREFLADSDLDKRNRAIDAVLQRAEYADFWAQRWADVLLVDRKKLGERGSYELHRWLHSQMQQNRPYDQWVRELLLASGNSARYGPVNFYRALRTPEERTRAVSQAFLGIRIDCAQCHHHPFDKWSQHDFYGLSGFFNGIELKQIESDRELLFYRGHTPISMPHTGELVATRPLDGESVEVDSADPRIQLADWLTDKHNPWFARIAVNRVWKHFLGRGLVEPEDDLRLTNPPTNAALLDFLEQRFVESGFDLKELAKLILQSRTYQLSSRANATNASDAQNFSHYYVKRLRADVLLDAICQSTGVAEQYAGMPEGTRAIELWDNRLPSYFLDTFGRSQRTSPCECGSSETPTMAQTLHLMNAPEINQKISSPRGRVAQLLAQGLEQEALVKELCLTVLGRKATAKEHRIATQLFATASRQKASEDFLWTLLNSYDFLFVH